MGSLISSPSSSATPAAKAGSRSSGETQPSIPPSEAEPGSEEYARAIAPKLSPARICSRIPASSSRVASDIADLIRLQQNVAKFPLLLHDRLAAAHLIQGAPHARRFRS